MSDKLNFTIGVIEDDSFQLRAIMSFLHTTYPKADVWSATRVADAEKRIKEKPPKLLILDVHLNGGDCWELLDLFPIEKRAFKVISITGDQSEDTLNKLNSHKVDCIHQKPLNFPALVTEIDSCITGRPPEWFYGREEGIGSVEVNFDMKLTQLSESFATVETMAGLNKGVNFKLRLFGQLVPMKVIDVDRDAITGISTIKAAILSDQMSIEEQKILRCGIVQQVA